MRLRLALRILASLAATVTTTRADDPAVSIADLAAYQTALAAPRVAPSVAQVTFRELWEHPQAHQGQPVQVEGRVARLFRQPGVGQFPPLVEAWITSPLGEPTCLVFPSGTGRGVPDLGTQVRFGGTFLRRITYPGGDTQRVAPLVVGPEAPIVLDSGPSSGGASFGPIFGGNPAADWGIGLLAALAVAGVLARRHLNRPAPVTAPIGPTPLFLDGGRLDPALSEGADDDDC